MIFPKHRHDIAIWPWETPDFLGLQLCLPPVARSDQAPRRRNLELWGGPVGVGTLAPHFFHGHLKKTWELKLYLNKKPTKSSTNSSWINFQAIVHGHETISVMDIDVVQGYVVCEIKMKALGSAGNPSHLPGFVWWG